MSNDQTATTIVPLRQIRLNVGRGSTSADRSRGEAYRRPSRRSATRRRRPDPPPHTSEKDFDSSGAAGPVKAAGSEPGEVP